MKFLRLILPFFVVPLLCACGVSSSVVNTSSSSKVIIAVNTDAGIGYFVDSEGKFLFGKQFDHVYSFFEGFAPVEQNGKYGLVNTTGEVVVPCIYDDAGRFYRGFAKVRKDGKWSIINAKGEVIVAECSENTSWSVVEF